MMQKHQSNQSKQSQQSKWHLAEGEIPLLPTIPHYAQQKHVKVGQFIKSCIFGGVDGTITTLSVILSSFAAKSSTTHLILAIGFSSLIGNAISMACADYLGTKSDDEFMKKQEQRQRQEIQTDIESEINQMLAIYDEIGLQSDISKQIVGILASNKEGFLKVMMIEELQLIAGGQNPIRNSIVTFSSFFIFGLMPLIPIILANLKDNKIPNYNHLAAAIAIAAFEFIFLGFSKSFITTVMWYSSILQTMVIGGVAAGTAFVMALLLGSNDSSD